MTSAGGEMTEEGRSREWLLRCHGFRVDGPEGLVGVVVAVVYGHSTRWDRPSALAVRGRRGEILVPMDAIAGVDAAEGRISLRASPSTEPRAG
jgi:hypothetical protein